MRTEVVLIIVIAIILIGYVIGNYLKKKHYETIDTIDRKKEALFERSLGSDFQKATEVELTGQSQTTFEKLQSQWQEIETNHFPSIENHLFEAEKATDRYFFSKASSEEKKAEGIIEETTKNMSSLSDSLKELLENEEKNREESFVVEERYQQIRNNLLTHSFTYGPALEAMENRLTDMEHDFAVFKERTSAHDHVDAQTVLDSLKEKIDDLIEIAGIVPELLERMEEEIAPQMEEIQEALVSMQESGYRFKEDDIHEKSEKLKDEMVAVKEEIRHLNLNQAEEQLNQISEEVEQLYTDMENEIRAKSFVVQAAPDLRKAFTYLNERNRRFRIETDRLNQVYVLKEDLLKKGPQYQARLEEMKIDFEKLASDVSREGVVYTEIQKKYETMMDELEEMNADQERNHQSLLSLNEETVRAKEKLLHLQTELQSIRRHLEMQQIPGLHDDYLDLYFQTSDRLDQLEFELSKNRLDIERIYELVTLCEEDVNQVQEESKQLLDEAMLTEYLVQYLNRYRKDHPDVSSSIEQSTELFQNEFDYAGSLSVLVEKLEEIEPGAYEKIKARYEEEKEAVRG